MAIATPAGRGGIGCVRLSGPEAWSIAERLFAPSGRAPRAEAPPAFGRFLNRDGVAVDHGYLVLFERGRSFTGERTAELWAHGSPAVLAELVETAVEAGAEPAGPGEFTYRALRNGRLDLARAEAVRDLVASRTAYQARVAFTQAEGALSERLAPLREALAEQITRLEAAVEFVDESETQLERGGLVPALALIERECRAMLDGFQRGRLVREGATLALIGLPNVGKSSLFNCLLARERAIVTPVAGTTRDTVEEQLDLDGIPVRLVDTAGLRQTDDPVELEGVRRAERAGKEADLVLLVLDASRGSVSPREAEALERADPHLRARTVVAWNKCDLVTEGAVPEVAGAWPVSALTGAGVAELRQELARRLGRGELAEDPVITNVRHAQALTDTLAALEAAQSGARRGLPEDLVTEDLRRAMHALGSITGEWTHEELYDRIFSTFCIGK